MAGLFLGLSTGVSCLAYCAPALMPFLLGEGQGTKKNIFTTVLFLSGRLAGYMLFALMAWFTHRWLLQNMPWRGGFLGIVYMTLAILLLVYGLRKVAPPCVGQLVHHGRFDGGKIPVIRWEPLCLGFLTGLNLCPPLLLAFTGASDTGSLGGSLWYFVTFFLGTVVFFIPMPFLGALGRWPMWRQIGKLTALVMGVYYIYIGLTLFLGGGSLS